MNFKLCPKCALIYGVTQVFCSECGTDLEEYDTGNNYEDYKDEESD